MQALKIFPTRMRALAIVLLSFWTATAQAPPPREAQVKAVFLFNFAQFAEWPAETFPNPTAPIIIGILGEDPFGPFLEKIVSNEHIGEHPIEIRRFASAEEARSCHILFIDKNKSRDIDQILEQLKGRNILTVSDMKDFASRGGMIGLFIEDNKTKFEINLKEYKDSNVVISSRVLRLATLCCE
ncbi:MAG: YfiR family protein [Bacteroidota bacterium]|nr:YfiR family protein [Bacteroidota bacterium]